MNARTKIFEAIREVMPDRRFSMDQVGLIDDLADALGIARLDGALTPSPACAAFIKGFEQCRLTAYLPTPDDVPTIGWGTTKGVRMGMVWTQAQADAAFAADLAEFGAKVAGMLGTAPTTQGQYDAMVSLAYNIGMGDPVRNIPGFLTSTVLRKHKAGDYVGAADAFAMWNKQAGKVLNGLTKRRAAERAMYLGVGA